MTNLQNDKQGACNRFEDFITYNATILNTIFEYAAGQTIFDNTLQAINAAVESQESAAKTNASQVDTLKL